MQFVPLKAQLKHSFKFLAFVSLALRAKPFSNDLQRPLTTLWATKVPVRHKIRFAQCVSRFDFPIILCTVSLIKVASSIVNISLVCTFIFFSAMNVLDFIDCTQRSLRIVSVVVLTSVRKNLRVFKLVRRTMHNLLRGGY